MLRMNACLLPTVDSDVDNRHFTHYSGYRPLSREVVLLFIAVIMLSTEVTFLPIVDSNPLSGQ
ncbi:hypothetical protein DUV33_25030 [Salmonella enterica subsp. enterica serovar Newport]|nr:hypothetical protein [Salmonella enterica subsp. enterica serovar Newport]